MRIRLAVALAAIMALAMPLVAAPVITYTTQGFFGTPPANPDTQPDTGLEYVGTPNLLFGGGTVDLGASNPTFVNFGYFNTQALLGTVGSTSVAGPFTLRVNQTGVDVMPGSLDFSGMISGSISGMPNHPGSGSDAKLTFDNPVFHPATGDAGPFGYIGNVEYHIGHAVYLLSAPTAGQITSINGSITGVPEPATIGLIGLGLVGLGFLARRRS